MACIYIFKFRSIEDQEILFDQILMGQLEFPVPYWDHVSDTAKVGNRLDYHRLLRHGCCQTLRHFKCLVKSL